jgi:Spy/CpxP family protein refolding chaperone
MMSGIGRGASEMMLLGNEDVQKELDLVEDQLTQLAKLREDVRAMYESMRDLPQEERMTKGGEIMQAAQKKTQQQVAEILLPHQADRMKQLILQYQIQMRGGSGLTSPDVAEKLGISEAEREKLGAKARELEQFYRKKQMEDLLKELTPEQQAKYKELAGKPFEFKQDERFGPGGRGPGGPGGRGGNAGGRGGRGN